MAGDKDTLTAQQVYDEIGKTYRFFLNWRYAVLSGYLVVLYFLFQAYSWLVENHLAEKTWVLLFIGSAISLFFWLLEIRIRGLYRVCIKVGHKLEKKHKIRGVYSGLDDHDLVKGVISHSHVLNVFFFIATLFFFVTGLVEVILLARPMP